MAFALARSVGEAMLHTETACHTLKRGCDLYFEIYVSKNEVKNIYLQFMLTCSKVIFFCIIINYA